MNFMSKCKGIQLRILDEKLQEAKSDIILGIIRKLATAKKVVDYDKEVAAGIYVYAVEELGKLEVLKTVQNGVLRYTAEFRNHNFKFKKAKEYLYKVGHSECFYLHDGAFSSVSFSSDSFDVDIESDTNARLGIFYMDLRYDKTNFIVTGIRKIPPVDEAELRLRIDCLENVINDWS
jgi:hypothetical protein